MATSNLGITELLESQSNKVVTVNEAFEALDNAGNRAFTQAVTGTADEIDAADFTRNTMFILTGTPGAPFVLTVPATARLFAIRNESDDECEVDAGGVTEFVPAGEARILHSDGTDIVSLGGGGGGTSGFATLNVQTGASYVPVLADADNVLIMMDSASGQDLLFPPDSDVAFPLGTVLNWMQIGVGLLSFDAEPGAVLNSRGGAVDSAGRWAQGTATKVAPDVWVLAGDIT